MLSVFCACAGILLLAMRLSGHHKEMSSSDFDLLAGADAVPCDSFQSEVRSDGNLHSDGSRLYSQPLNTSVLHQWLCRHVVDEKLQLAHTVFVFTDSHRLSDYPFFSQCTADLWCQRLRWTKTEKCHAVFVPISDENGLTSCHMTHAVVHVLRSLRARFPGKHFVSADADAGPTALSEVSQWLSVGRECHRLRMPANRHGSIRDGVMPGLLVCNDIGARVNAGLVISPGVGDFKQDSAQTPQAWCQLLHDRLQRLKARKCSSSPEFDNQRYSSHLLALASHTKLFGVLVEEPQDYLHLWAVLCNVLNVAAWSPSASRHDRAHLDAFSDAIRLALPRLDAWAGPFCEQPALAFLEVFQTESCPICYMPSELGYMMQYASKHIGTIDNVLQSAVMPPLFLHAYGGPAKTRLTSFRLGFWVNMSQSLHGALSWRPCFMDGVSDTISRVHVSCGFQVEMLISDSLRCMVDEQGWVETPVSCNALFHSELSQRTNDAGTWPLWTSLVHGLSISHYPVCKPAQVQAIDIACPGLQSVLLEHGQCGRHLFQDTPQLVFTNAGHRRYYGPTRERADHKSGSRNDDPNLNALHYLLRDVGCRNAWDVVLPDWDVAAACRSIPICPSWIADPDSSVVFAVLSTIFQFTPYRDSYLRFFGIDNIDSQCISELDIHVSIRGHLYCSDIRFFLFCIGSISECMFVFFFVL